MPSILSEEEFLQFINRLKAYPKMQEGLLSAPEKRRRGNISRLLRRSRALKQLGLKGGGAVTKEKAEGFFLDMYGVGYDDMCETFSDLKYLIGFLLSLKDEHNHVILFPLKSMLLPYYVARGLLYELQQDGLCKGVSVYTIGISSAVISQNVHDEQIEMSNYVHSQIKKILKNSGAKQASIVDYISRGTTVRYLQSVLAENNVQLAYILGIRDVSTIYGDINVDNLALKLRSGKVIPTSHAKTMDLKGKLYHSGVYLRPLEQAKPFSVGLTKELLFYFGRVFYRLNRNDKKVIESIRRPGYYNIRNYQEISRQYY